ncbi:MAG: hypothetical protein VX761_05295 [Planctomycetota bacterium]|nr:hypothetical protein [Planctomycetota bacterium]
MLRRIILVLTLILISAAAMSLVALGAIFLAGGLNDSGAAGYFKAIAIAGLFVSAVDLCLLVLTMAISHVDRTDEGSAERQRDVE